MSTIVFSTVNRPIWDVNQADGGGDQPLAALNTSATPLLQ